METTKPIEGVIVPTTGIKNDITREEKKKANSRSAELKRRKFIKVYSELGNAVKAYMQVFKCSIETANGLASNYLKKIDFSDLMEEQGVTDKALIDKIKEGTNATRPYGKNAIIHEDYATRHAYIETSLKLKGRLKKEEAQQPIMQGLSIVINK